MKTKETENFCADTLDHHKELGRLNRISGQLEGIKK